MQTQKQISPESWHKILTLVNKLKLINNFVKQLSKVQNKDKKLQQPTLLSHFLQTLSSISEVCKTTPLNFATETVCTKRGYFPLTY